jgi:exosortase/archaeosortase family protein
MGGTLVLWVINVLRISLVMLSNTNHWSLPFGWDHHTWFNIVAYGMIFLMIWVYDRNSRLNGLRV